MRDQSYKQTLWSHRGICNLLLIFTGIALSSWTGDLSLAQAIKPGEKKFQMSLEAYRSCGELGLGSDEIQSVVDLAKDAKKQCDADREHFSKSLSNLKGTLSELKRMTPEDQYERSKRWRSQVAAEKARNAKEIAEITTKTDDAVTALFSDFTRQFQKASVAARGEQNRFWIHENLTDLQRSLNQRINAIHRLCELRKSQGGENTKNGVSEEHVQMAILGLLQDPKFNLILTSKSMSSALRLEEGAGNINRCKNGYPAFGAVNSNVPAHARNLITIGGLKAAKKSILESLSDAELDFMKKKSRVDPKNPESVLSFLGDYYQTHPLLFQKALAESGFSSKATALCRVMAQAKLDQKQVEKRKKMLLAASLIGAGASVLVTGGASMALLAGAVAGLDASQIADDYQKNSSISSRIAHSVASGDERALREGLDQVLAANSANREVLGSVLFAAFGLGADLRAAKSALKMVSKADDAAEVMVKGAGRIQEAPTVALRAPSKNVTSSEEKLRIPKIPTRKEVLRFLGFNSENQRKRLLKEYPLQAKGLENLPIRDQAGSPLCGPHAVCNMLQLNDVLPPGKTINLEYVDGYKIWQRMNLHIIGRRPITEKSIREVLSDGNVSGDVFDLFADGLMPYIDIKDAATIPTMFRSKNRKLLAKELFEKIDAESTLEGKRRALDEILERHYGPVKANRDISKALSQRKFLEIKPGPPGVASQTLLVDADKPLRTKKIQTFRMDEFIHEDNQIIGTATELVGRIGSGTRGRIRLDQSKADEFLGSLERFQLSEFNPYQRYPFYVKQGNRFTLVKYDHRADDFLDSQLNFFDISGDSELYRPKTKMIKDKGGEFERRDLPDLQKTEDILTMQSRFQTRLDFKYKTAPMEEIESAIIQQLRREKAVFLSLTKTDYSSLGRAFHSSKAEDAHGVVIVGAKQNPDGSLKELLLLNSWGESAGKTGYYTLKWNKSTPQQVRSIIILKD